jgi:hypothetical protein
MSIPSHDPIVVAPSPTPFRDDDSVDYEAIERNVRRWLDTPLSGFVLNSENGEEAFLSERERLEMAGRLGLPQVVSLGALDMVNFGARETVPERFEDRNLYVHNPVDKRRKKLGSKLGFPMSHGRRPQVIDRLLMNMHANRQVGNLYPELRNELATFVRNEKGRLEADVGQHDDLVMSLAGALWVLTEETKPGTRPEGGGTPPPDQRHKLKAIWEKVDHARAAEQQRLADEARRMDRRAKLRERHEARREARKPALTR